MPNTVDRNSPLPIRTQVREFIVSEIRQGVFAPDRRIPSERELALRYGASRSSVREAIAELISEGVLYRVGARGVFAARLGAARARNAGMLRQIGFWISEPVFHFIQAGYTRILTGAETACRASGFSLRFYSVDEQKQPLRTLFSSDSDIPELAGHLLAGGLQTSVAERLCKLGAPLVVVDPLLDQQLEGADLVQIDYAGGTREAVKHLAELGHRDIGFIGFPGSRKYEAFWRSLEEFGLPYSPRFVQFLQMPELAPSVLAGYQCASRLLSSGAKPTALIASNDLVAVGALDAIAAAGLSVPGDVSVVGFDDLGHSPIPLTTVRVDLTEVGRTAAQVLLERLANPTTAPRNLLVSAELVVRATTAPPRSSAISQNL
ncbi:MAG: GntR family transcriptional regulator [Bryobacteraceae bacterium]|nr:GntR family transcriptional regulator [Bryobacteraceae bacterium]